LSDLLEPIPEELARVAGLMSDYDRSWALCGGWAVDAWLGRTTRRHEDVDLSVFHDEQDAVFEYFTEGWLLNGHDRHDDDGTDPWTGRTLDFPAHIHARSEGFDLDIQLDRRTGDEWLFSRRAGLTLPVEQVITPSPWRLPTLVPEAALFYKAIGAIRPHDEADFRVLAPELRGDQRRWLHDALVALRPGHEWLPTLASEANP
jgi:Aminoglycoside-2''-adenylyltransferase